MGRQVALLRGINVGGNSTVPMATLRVIFAELGCTDVATVLNSGNVVFSGDVTAAALEKRIFEETGVSTRVLIVDGPRLRGIVEAMPFEGDESRLLVTLMGSVPAVVDRPSPEQLAPEQLQIGPDAVYGSLPDGISKTKLKPAFWKQFPPEATGRNLRTVKKLVALL
ncbi:MAG: hypothetical protein JWP19_1235 [Rhodoglobus sp.]|nr:hypothetical protein [Rhodoglobus sp.]